MDIHNRENHCISPSLPSWLQDFFTPTKNIPLLRGLHDYISPLLPPSASINYFHPIYFLSSYSLNLSVILNKSNTKQSTPDSSSAASLSRGWKWIEVASGQPVFSASVRLLFHQFSRGYSSWDYCFKSSNGHRKIWTDIQEK